MGRLSPKVTSTNTPLQLTRSSKEEIYSLIEEDLTLPWANLPEKSDLSPKSAWPGYQRGCRGYLAKVHLFQNEFPQQNNMPWR
jgi:hypothetical protein